MLGSLLRYPFPYFGHSEANDKILNPSFQEYNNRPLPDIIEALRRSASIYCQCQLWGIILNREGPNYEVNGKMVIDALRELYYRAGTLRYWRGVRYCSSLLHHTVDSISPFITSVLVSGKQVRTIETNFKSIKFIWY